MDIEVIGSVAIMLVLVGVFIYCMMPPVWQNPLGFLLIVAGIVPAGLVVLTLLAKPALLIPAVFIMGALMASRRRAS